MLRKPGQQGNQKEGNRCHFYNDRWNRYGTLVPNHSWQCIQERERAGTTQEQGRGNRGDRTDINLVQLDLDGRSCTSAMLAMSE